MSDKYGIDIFVDVVRAMPSDATVHFIGDDVWGYFKYRGHDVSTLFKSDGIMNIFEANIYDIKEDEIRGRGGEIYEKYPNVLYDFHWNTYEREGYREALKKFFGE